MYTTQNNRQRDSQIVRQRGGGGTDRCIQLRTIDREIVRQRRGGGGTDRCIQLRSIDKEIVRQRGGGGGTDRCIHHRTIDKEIVRQIERRRRQVKIDVYNLEQQIQRQLDENHYYIASSFIASLFFTSHFAYQVIFNFRYFSQGKKFEQHRAVQICNTIDKSLQV